MKNITAQEMYAVIERGKNGVFIDIRSTDEFARGHAKDFVNIPLDDIARDIRYLPKADVLYFMCHSGGRSRLAVGLAEARGLNAANIEGGFSAWQKAGLPTD